MRKQVILLMTSFFVWGIVHTDSLAQEDPFKKTISVQQADSLIILYADSTNFSILDVPMVSLRGRPIWITTRMAFQIRSTPWTNQKSTWSTACLGAEAMRLAIKCAICNLNTSTT